MLAYSAMGIVTVLWSLVGFSLAFAPNLKIGSADNKIIGDGSYATLDLFDSSTAPYSGAPTITLHTFAMYQLMFAIITSSIIAGAIAGKMKYLWFLAFTGLWHILMCVTLARDNSPCCATPRT
jgi:Amt family ammonium transporter